MSLSESGRYSGPHKAQGCGTEAERLGLLASRRPQLCYWDTRASGTSCIAARYDTVPGPVAQPIHGKNLAAWALRHWDYLRNADVIVLLTDSRSPGVFPTWGIRCLGGKIACSGLALTVSDGFASGPQ